MHSKERNDNQEKYVITISLQHNSSETRPINAKECYLIMFGIYSLRPLPSIDISFGSETSMNTNTRGGRKKITICYDHMVI